MSWQPTEDDGNVHYWRPIRSASAVLYAFPSSWSVLDGQSHQTVGGPADGLVDAMERADEWAADRWPVQREETS